MVHGVWVHDVLRCCGAACGCIRVRQSVFLVEERRMAMQAHRHTPYMQTHRHTHADTPMQHTGTHTHACMHAHAPCPTP